MRKRLQRLISLTLSIIMVLGFSITPQALNIAGQATGGKQQLAGDPFAAMYDSDAVFVEAVEPLLGSIARELEASVESELEAEPVKGSLSTTTKGELAAEVSSVQEAVSTLQSASAAEAVLESLTASQPDSLVKALPEHQQEELSQLYEDSRVDRFLVKYKDNSTGNCPKDGGVHLRV